MGSIVTAEEFAGICLKLEEEGASNINLVTGTHFIPSIASGLEKARIRGLSLPVVWNSSGYECIDALEYIDPFIDVYLPDLKTLDPDISRKFFKSSNYPEYAREAAVFLASRSKPAFSGEKLVKGTLV